MEVEEEWQVGAVANNSLKFFLDKLGTMYL